MSTTPQLVLVTGPSSTGKTRYITTVVTKMRTTTGRKPITLNIDDDYSTVDNNTVQFAAWTAGNADQAWQYIQKVYNGIDSSSIMYVQPYNTTVPDYITAIATTVVNY